MPTRGPVTRISAAPRVDLDQLASGRQRLVSPLPRQIVLAERPQLARPGLDGLHVSGQRPHFEHPCPREAELLVETDGRLVLLEHLEGHVIRSVCEHRLHQRAPDPFASLSRHDAEPSDPASVAPHAEIDDPDRVTVAERTRDRPTSMSHVSTMNASAASSTCTGTK